jgi:hypothetical protein
MKRQWQKRDQNRHRQAAAHESPVDQLPIATRPPESAHGDVEHQCQQADAEGNAILTSEQEITQRWQQEDHDDGNFVRRHHGQRPQQQRPNRHLERRRSQRVKLDRIAALMRGHPTQQIAVCKRSAKQFCPCGVERMIGGAKRAHEALCSTIRQGNLAPEIERP